jgi:protein subunit release factor A
MITNFKIFEDSYFHSMTQIDEILDKINDYGYENLDDSDKAILLNYSKNDEDIHNILLIMNKMTKKFLKLNQKLSILSKGDEKELEKAKNEWFELNDKMSDCENKLRYLYKIEDVNDIWNYQKSNNITPDNDY